MKKNGLWYLGGGDNPKQLRTLSWREFATMVLASLKRISENPQSSNRKPLNNVERTDKYESMFDAKSIAAKDNALSDSPVDKDADSK